jgi:ABC-type polysaccharide/polyol phosphate export permease
MPATFIHARGFIESFELPWLIHIWRRSISFVLVFLHQIVTLLVLMVGLSVPFRWEMLYAVPALFVVMAAGSGIGMALGVFGARYRDLQPAMGVLSGFLFFISPVMWRAEQLNENEWIVQYNPLHYIITLVRDPLLGRVSAPEIWIGALIAAGGALVVGLISFTLGRRRLYYWM